MFDSKSAKRALQIKAGKASIRARVKRIGLEGQQAEAARMREIRMMKLKAKADCDRRTEDSDELLDHSDTESGTYVAPKDK